eukprot:scaffold3323_cov279-Pinguiococcus_pyrenoidosus.AAC.3
MSESSVADSTWRTCIGGSRALTSRGAMAVALPKESSSRILGGLRAGLALGPRSSVTHLSMVTPGEAIKGQAGRAAWPTRRSRRPNPTVVTLSSIRRTGSGVSELLYRCTSSSGSSAVSHAAPSRPTQMATGESVGNLQGSRLACRYTAVPRDSSTSIACFGRR